MSFKSFTVLCAAAAVTSLAGSMSAGAAMPVGMKVIAERPENATNLWFVQLGNAPAAKGTSQQSLQAEKKAFRDAATTSGVRYTERFAFNTLWNGFSVQATSGEIAKIRELPGVKAIFPVGLVSAPERPTTITPDLYTAITMTGADVVQNEMGYTGKGIKVAVMDTGIDVDHVAFGGDGVARSNSPLFPTTRVAYGYDFVGDAYNADPTSPSYNPIPNPDSDPDDCAGHGSHVAGIIGANDPTNDLKGVAPEVTFGAYRVFGCEGSTTDDVMIAAMERALADGMQVLNMSIGSAFDWGQAPTAVAASNLVDAGMVVVASIGNSGASGLYSAGAPGLGDKVIGVASFDNIAVYQDAFAASTDTTISDDDSKLGYTPAAAAPTPPSSGAYPMARTGTTTTTNDACSALAPGSLTGKVALIRRGTCGFYNKAFNAQSAGAIAVVLYNNAAGFVNPTVAGSPPVTIPVVMITQSAGAIVDARIQAGTTYLIWGAGKVSTPAPTGNLISSFSSYGLSPDLTLKPDIGAPGGNIWSTYPIELGAYASLSGTSMSSPHVAGEAALLLQAKPGTKAGDVRTILQNTAVPKPWFGNPGLGFLDNVHRQGAGMVQIDAAIMATTRVDPGKISMGEGEAGPRSQVLTVSNTGSSAVTYGLTSINALSTSGIVTPGFTTSDASVAFSSASVTVPAGGKASVTATITPASGPVNGQYGGYIVLTPQGGGQVYRVPFAGFVGDYQGIQAITPTTFAFPWLAISFEGDFYGPVTGPDDWVYSMVGEDIPYFLIHFEHQVQHLEASIRNATTGALVHPVFNIGFEADLLPRNSTATGFFAFGWDGTRIHSNGYNGKGYTKDLTKMVPDGQYIITIKGLKANGNPANPAHWETWTSPVVAIDRP